MRERQPFMPLFFGDFLAATTTWDGAEQALYLLVLAYEWSSGPLPTDTTRLARVVRYELPRFLELWRVVGVKFTATAEGLVNLRLEEHRRKAKSISKLRSRLGREGVQAKRKQSDKQTGKQNGKQNGYDSLSNSGVVAGSFADELASQKGAAKRKHPNQTIPILKNQEASQGEEFRTEGSR